MSEEIPGESQDESKVVDPKQLALFEQYLAVQAEEIDIRRQELELSKDQQSQGHEYACKMLDAQKEDRKETREAWLTDRRRIYILVGCGVLAGFLLLLVALWRNQSEVALELLKLAVVVAGSGFGGFAIGKQKGIQQTRKEYEE